MAVAEGSTADVSQLESQRAEQRERAGALPDDAVGVPLVVERQPLRHGERLLHLRDCTDEPSQRQVNRVNR